MNLRELNDPEYLCELLAATGAAAAPGDGVAPEAEVTPGAPAARGQAEAPATPLEPPAGLPGSHPAHAVGAGATRTDALGN